MSRRGVGACLAAAIVTGALAGCATQDAGLGSTSPDMARFQQDVASLERTTQAGRALAEQRLNRIETDLRREFDSTARQSEDSRSLLNQRLHELLTEFRIVQGKLEENTLALGKVERRVDALQARVQKSATDLEGLERRVRTTEQPAREPAGGGPSISETPGRQPVAATAPIPAPRSPTAAPPAKAPGRATPAPAQTASVQPEEVYRAAVGDYNRGDYDFAIAGFRTYLRNYPGTSLAASAQLMLGEAYFGLKNYVQAIEEFNGVLRGYPDDPAVPAALLKQGEAYLRLEDRAQGGRTLCDLIGRFPNSREARLARERNPRCG